jgi:hypothetical protein
MISAVVHQDSDLIPAEVSQRINTDVIDALSAVASDGESRLIVNDSQWFNVVANKKGIIEPKPRVMNSADFLSKKFGNFIESRNWAAGTGEVEIEGQKMDGFIELKLEQEFFSLPKNKILESLKIIFSLDPAANEKIKFYFDILYNLYCSRSYPLVSMIKPISHLLVRAPDRKIRIGLEFETGNIASSFRAFSKLNFLFNENKVDIGVFVTSLNKAECAAKIWPISNRNGSIEELQNRNYRSSLLLPMIEFGFKPDGFDKTAKFLDSDGTLYSPKPSREIQIFDGSKYQKHTYKNTTIWKKL